MAVVQLQPDMGEGSLVSGFKVPRNTALHSQLGKDDQTACEFRTAHEVTLWPVELVEARYFACGTHVAGVDLSRLGGVKAALRLRLSVGAGLAFSDLALDTLALHIRGGDALPSRVLEQLLAQAAGVVVMPVQASADWHQILPKSAIRSVGYSDGEALLPPGPRAFQGYRLLQEYFALPQRFMFIDVVGLAASVRRCTAGQLDVIVLFKQVDPLLEQNLSAANFALHCTPVINLFPMRTERVHLVQQRSEYHVSPDRMRPMDYEIYQIEAVTGYGSGAEASQAFEPFYRANDLHGRKPPRAYYQVRRDARVLSEPQRSRGPQPLPKGPEPVRRNGSQRRPWHRRPAIADSRYAPALRLPPVGRRLHPARAPAHRAPETTSANAASRAQ